MKGEGGVFTHCQSHSKERIEHFLLKALVMKCLQEKRHKAFMEQSVGDGSVDCYDYTTKYAYEIEPRIDNKKLIAKFNKYSLGGAEEVIMIPYKELWDRVGVTPKQLRDLRKLVEMYLNA